MPFVGVNVPQSCNTTQWVLFTQADWPLLACTVTTPATVHVADTVCEPLAPPATADEAARPQTMRASTTALMRRFTWVPSSVASTWTDTHGTAAGMRRLETFCGRLTQAFRRRR